MGALFLRHVAPEDCKAQTYGTGQVLRVHVSDGKSYRIMLNGPGVFLSDGSVLSARYGAWSGHASILITTKGKGGNNGKAQVAWRSRRKYRQCASNE